jgi:hypothetical protein
MLRRGGTRLLLTATAVCLGAGSLHAATLAVDAPEGCVDVATLEQEVADLVGRPLAQVPETDFRLTIRQQPGGRWHLQLQASERAAAPEGAHVRELEAASCSELGEAAAVAIAVSIRALGETSAGPKREAPRPAPPRSISPPLTNAAPAERSRWRPGLTFGLAADTGDLPDIGVGVMAGATLRRRAIRLAATLGWIPSRDKLVPGAPGGQFQLAVGTLDACFVPSWGSWSVMGCLGGELGAYRATGLEVARPETRTTFWRAPRGGLGAALALSGAVSVLVQGTAVVPWARPEFVVNGTDRVYRPDPVAVRVGAGLDVLF